MFFEYLGHEAVHRAARASYQREGRGTARFVLERSLDGFALTANAADADGTVARVEFYENGTLVGSDTTSPYAFTWVTSAAGPHTLTAVATDNLNATTTSAPVHITVTGAAGRTNVALASNGGVAVGFILKADRRGPVLEVERSRQGLSVWADQGAGQRMLRGTILALPRLLAPNGGEYGLTPGQVRGCITGVSRSRTRKPRRPRSRPMAAPSSPISARAPLSSGPPTAPSPRSSRKAATRPSERHSDVRATRE